MLFKLQVSQYILDEFLLKSNGDKCNIVVTQVWNLHFFVCCLLHWCSFYDKCLFHFCFDNSLVQIFILKNVNYPVKVATSSARCHLFFYRTIFWPKNNFFHEHHWRSVSHGPEWVSKEVKRLRTRIFRWHRFLWRTMYKVCLTFLIDSTMF